MNMTQAEYLQLLMSKPGYDEQDLGIQVERLSKKEISKLIDELKKELYGYDKDKYHRRFA
jgi:hypothetical protein